MPKTKKVFYVHNCRYCKSRFRTDTEVALVCPKCQEKHLHANAGLHSDIDLIERYNERHGTRYTYGQFKMLIQQNKITKEELHELEKGSGKRPAKLPSAQTEP